MSNITIQKRKIDRQKGIVILPLKEYEKLRVQATPTYYLAGRAAEKLDALVEGGLKDCKAGRTRKIQSLADLD